MRYTLEGGRHGDNINKPVVIGTAGSQISRTEAEQAQIDKVRALTSRAHGADEGDVTTAVNAAQRYLGTSPEHRYLTLDDLRTELAGARDAVSFVVAEARGIAVVAIEDGWSEVALADRLGVDRMTLRKWLGK
jgi:hypothetical protein